LSIFEKSKILLEKKNNKKSGKTCDHKNSYAKDVKKYLNNLLAYFFLINLFFIFEKIGDFLVIIQMVTNDN